MVLILILGTDGLSCSLEARLYNCCVGVGFLALAIVSALGILVLASSEQ